MSGFTMDIIDTGAGIALPPRPFLPDETLPPDWLQAIISRVNDAVGGGSGP